MGVGKLYKLKDSGYSLTHLPYKLSLCVETSLAIYYISVDNQKELWKYTISTHTDALITTRTSKVQALWYDRTNGLIWGVDCDNDGVSHLFYSWYITIATDAITSVASKDMGAIFPYAYDIFIISNVVYALITSTAISANYIYQVDVDPFVQKAVTADQFHPSEGIVVSGTTDYYYFGDNEVGTVTILHYPGGGAGINELDAIVGYSQHTSYLTVAYDGSDRLFFVLTKDADNLEYLCSYSISADEIININAEYNIALMSDRNCSGTAPNESEKGFDIARDVNNYSCTYELKGNGKAGVLQSQTILKASNISAITDNYLIFADKTIWAQTNLLAETPRYIAQITIEDGIFPTENSCDMVIHPDYMIYFYENDMIKIYDSSSVLGFKGFCYGPERDEKGVYYIEVEAYKNELLARAYNKAYTANKTSEKQTDILDNSMQYCYQSASITATALNYDYNQQGLTAKIFELGRFLERQIVYCEPDGKVWTKPHDALVDSTVNWNQASGIFIPLDEDDNANVCYSNKKTGITFAEVLGGVNSLGEVYRRYPATTSAEELSAYPKALLPWQDMNIMNDTEALQLATNRYNIFNPIIQFVCFGMIKDAGFLQPGKTLTFEFTSADGQFVIASFQALIVDWKWDPINDLIYDVVLTDSIISYEEWEDHLLNSGDEAVRAACFTGTTASTADGTVLTQSAVNELRADVPAHIALTDTAHGGSLCRIKTGTYTGDGTADWSKTIACGFAAKVVHIYTNLAADGNDQMFLYIDEGNKRSFINFGGTPGAYDNRVRSSATGFQVSDDGADYPPNKNGITYVYVAFG